MTTDHFAAGAHSRPPPRPPRRWFRIVVVALGLALLGGLGGYVLHKLTRPDVESAQEAPLIRADESPIKKRPAEPGGLAIPNQDKLVYEALSEYGREEKVEVLLPPPEEPLPAPTSAAPQPVAPEEPAEAEAPPEKPETSETPETPETPEPTTEIATAEPEAAAPSPETAAPAPEPPAKAATAASPKPAEAATVAAAPTAAAKAFMVQLGAYRKATAADTGWRRLQKANRDLLGELKPKVVRADLGADKGVFFRLRAGPLGDEAAAKALCARLKVRRQGCFIIRPGRP